MPSEDNNILKFTNVHFQQKIPFVIYADFECILARHATASPNPAMSFSEILATHIPCGYSYAIVGPTGELVKPPVVYRGENSVNNFLNALLEEEKNLLASFKISKSLQMSPDDWQHFNKATHCHICDKPLSRNDRVRDHCHFTGQFRGAAHQKCNARMRKTYKIPVVIHNLKNYDAHILMDGIGKYKEKKITCIANNMEKYVTFSLGHLHFIDSFQFLGASLATLVENTCKDQFPILSSQFRNLSKFTLMIKKGVYPYEYMDSFEKFDETQLPPISEFYSSLTNTGISEEEYSHALKVWDTFSIRTLGEYHDLYVLSDVLLLADIFENFRKLCLSYYKIDPSHVYTAPGLAWQACLKMTGVELELLTDPTMHLFIEKGIRGGMSMISNRFSVANHKYLPNHSGSEPSKYIMYLDANNLYGWGMCRYLPVRAFEWVPPNTIHTQDILGMDDDSEYGYIFEVDLDYPSDLHDLHNDYPLAPERMSITPDMMSQWLKDTASEFGMELSKTCPKLITSLLPKTHYIVHYQNLKCYLHLGLILTRIHRCIRFQQSPWLKPYIEFNTQKRKYSSSAFEKDFFKLMNNSVFGKTIENLKNHVNIELVHDDKRAKKLVSTPAFKKFNEINNDLVVVERYKVKLILNKPIYTGFSILDMSKILMYNFHYQYVKSMYGPRAKLLFTDTDSLCYEIQTEDVYVDMLQNIELFDTSDYPPSHPLYNLANKKVLGKMKDELSGIPIESFVGLRPKMYALKTLKGDKKTAKGVQRNVVKEQLTFTNYVNTLFSGERGRAIFNKIGSKLHRLYTYRVSKQTLCPLDDKRFVLDDGIGTLAYGHYKIPH